MDVYEIILITLGALGLLHLAGWAIVLDVVHRRITKEFINPLEKMTDDVEAHARELYLPPSPTLEELPLHEAETAKCRQEVEAVKEFLKRAPSAVAILDFTPCPWHWWNLVWGDWVALGYIYPSDERV